MRMKKSSSKIAGLLILIFLSTVSSHKTAAAKCPKNSLKLGECGSWLGLIHETIGSKPSKECCAVIEGIADLEAAICVCTALNANVVGVVNIEVPVAVSLFLSACGKQVPQGFQCPIN